MIQLTAVVIAVAAAVCYAGWRVSKVVRQQHDPCCGCKGCELDCKMKNCLNDKKTCEKFGQSK